MSRALTEPVYQGHTARYLRVVVSVGGLRCLWTVYSDT